MGGLGENKGAVAWCLRGGEGRGEGGKGVAVSRGKEWMS